MTFDWDLWPLIIARDAPDSVSAQMAEMMAALGRMQRAIADELAPTFAEVSARLTEAFAAYGKPPSRWRRWWWRVEDALLG